MTRRLIVALLLLAAGCGNNPEGGEELWSYERLNLHPPVTWEELERELEATDRDLDTVTVRHRHDMWGRPWRSLRVVRPDTIERRLELTPARIKVRLLSRGQVTRFGPSDPGAYMLDYTGDGFYLVLPHVLIPTGSELIVEADDWGDFQFEEGRLILHEEGVEFVPGEVSIPPGLCDAYEGLLFSSGRHECGPDAVSDGPAGD